MPGRFHAGPGPAHYSRHAAAEKRHQRPAQGCGAACEVKMISGTGLDRFPVPAESRAGRTRGGRSPAPDRSSRPAMALSRFMRGRAGADSGCRPARRCRCGWPSSDEAGRELGGDILVRARASPLSADLGAARRVRAAPTSVTSQPLAKSSISALGVFASIRCPWCRVPTRAWSAKLAQAGLIAGTVPTNGTL